MTLFLSFSHKNEILSGAPKLVHCSLWYFCKNRPSPSCVSPKPEISNFIRECWCRENKMDRWLWKISENPCNRIFSHYFKKFPKIYLVTLHTSLGPSKSRFKVLLTSFLIYQFLVWFESSLKEKPNSTKFISIGSPILIL